MRTHLPRLRRVARGNVLELGVRGGNSTTALLAGLEERRGMLWSVDVDASCAALFDGHPQWRFVHSDSRDATTIDAQGAPAQLDILFVDTIHTYEQVRAELETWGDRVRRGGLILFHDTDSFPEIRRAIAAWCRPRGVPYTFHAGSYGLGVAYPGRGRAFGAALACARLAHVLIRDGAVFAKRVGRRLRRTIRVARSG
jgi:hypothetical protein